MDCRRKSPRNPSMQTVMNKIDSSFDKRDFLFCDMSTCIRKQIQLDKVAQYSTTDMRTADKISEFIANLNGLEKDRIAITDGTACVGGNTSSFCKKFKHVQAIELNKTRYNMLRNNLKILKHENVICYHGDYLEYLPNLQQDVVFLDPPWGGPTYKDQVEVELFIGRVPLHEVCEQLKLRTKYIVIKAPQNFNCRKFQEKVSGSCQVYYEFRKMFVAATAIALVIDYYNDYEIDNACAYANRCAYDVALKTATHAILHGYDPVDAACHAAVAAYLDACINFKMATAAHDSNAAPEYLNFIDNYDYYDDDGDENLFDAAAVAPIDQDDF
ncbi:unnamed protein product [Adineta steineri]|uniref:Trimethylguanosine synthase n=1 Tax=Adineta steineri TaxID=433720 RepID=A0A814Q616_9BILA|nr:unnamed protein product [Adineta steineri]